MARTPKLEQKERLTIWVDKRVVAYFKHIAELEERPYQPLMNKVLVDYYDALPDEAKLIRQDR